MVSSATPVTRAAVSAARAAILDLLAARDADKTICPSEAAHAIGGAAWRDAMPAAHAAARALVAEGLVELRQGGARRDPDAIIGAYRIARTPSAQP